MEEWKQIVESYEISNYGNCRRKCLNGLYKTIDGAIQNRGYRYFQLIRDGKRINYLFHHLVAEAFLSERPNDLVIDHIDRNKLNNHVSNLRYITQKENCRNTDVYRHDISSTNPNERRRIMSRERDIKSGRNSQIRRPRGTGCIQQHGNGYRITITINSNKIVKSFDTKEEAEGFIEMLIECNAFMNITIKDA
jgi:hypothetical protein